MLFKPLIPKTLPFSRLMTGLFAMLMFVVLNAGAAEAPSLQELKNMDYQGIYDQGVTLEAGLYEGEPFVEGGASRPRVQFLENLYGFGDLNGDGAEDAALLLSENSGGSGVNVYLAVVERRDGELRNVATRLIGDRVQIHSLKLDQGVVVMELVMAGPDDPACCPSLKVRKGYRLEGDELTEVATEERGQRAPTP